MAKNFKTLNVLGLRESINSIMSNPNATASLIKVCKGYMKKLDEGTSEGSIYEEFIEKVSGMRIDETCEKILESINTSAQSSKRNLDILKCVDDMNNSYLVPMIESCLVEYLTNKNDETRSAALSNLSLFESDKNVSRIMEHLKFEGYESANNVALKNVDYIKEEETKTYIQDEVDAMLESAKQTTINEMETARIQNKKTTASIETNINLAGTINKILKESKSDKLKIFCDQYLSALRNGKPEETLYESFISGASNWNYLSSVDTELSALSDRINKYKQNIDLKKILEIMKSTSSYYIVPLIEDVVADYTADKNVNNKVVLKNRLQCFEYDQYVRDILNVVNHDDSIENTVYLGESVENLNTQVHTEKIYSPVQYIKENECVFNVKGTFYTKKDNNINKIPKSDVVKLSESFRNLCNILNRDNVIISDLDNTITVYAGNNTATISESAIILNKQKVTPATLDLMSKNSFLMNEHMENFYGTVKLINENFDMIAPIDFCKRVSSNDNSRKSVDVFRINNNIYVNTIDESLGTSTFYRNVNPIQCRSYINEHLDINAMPMFEDMLPEQEKIKEDIDETKKAMLNGIDALEDKKKELESMKTEDADSAEEIDKAIKEIDKEIEDAKAEYDSYDKEMDKYVNGDDENKKDVEDEPEDSEHVDDTAETDEPKETETDMSSPIGDVNAEPEEVDTFADVPEFDATFDTPTVGGEDYDYKVVNVSFDENLKTGEKTGKGSVILVIPSINADGARVDDMRKFTFYLNDEHKPIIENDFMSISMYKAMETAILNDPRVGNIPSAGEPSSAPVEASLDTVDVDVNVEPVDSSTSSAEAIADTIAPADSSTNVSIINNPDEMIDVPSRETPAETADHKDEVTYPIDFEFNTEDVSPIPQSEFECELSKMGIKHSVIEGTDTGITMSVANKAQAYALKNYFKEWKNFTDEGFCDFFPELQKCFNNKCSTIKSGPIQEGVHINNVRVCKSLNENVFVLPYSDDYAKLLNIKSSGLRNPGTIQIHVENNDDICHLYESLSKYGKTHELDEDAKAIMESLEDVYNEENTITGTVPFNGFLQSKLRAAGVSVNKVDESMEISVSKKGYKKTKKIMEGFYGKNVPAEAKTFLNEEVKVTVYDSNTGKTITIYDSSSENNDKKDASDSSNVDFDAPFKDTAVTFNTDDSEAFNAPDEDSDEATDEQNESKEETENTDDNAQEKKSEKKKPSDEEKEEKDDKPKQKFKFVVKKKKTDESKSAKFENSLNESAKPNVLDYVYFDGDKKGQIISQCGNGDFIVSAYGKTIQTPKGSVRPVTERPDTVECPYKFDENTLKGLFEQMVPCGMYMNNMKITPSDCYVKYSEWKDAGENDKVSIVVEGMSISADRKNVRINEDVNSFANIHDYSPATYTKTNEDILVNVKDLNRYMNESAETGSVRALVFNQDKTTKLINVNGNSVILKK